MTDRGIIKWQPFDSCFASRKILNDITKKKESISCPHLSEDQLYTLEEKIINAYHLNEIINIKYFYNGKIFYAKGKITFINVYNKKLRINDKDIYFKQILNIFEDI